MRKRHFAASTILSLALAVSWLSGETRVYVQVVDENGEAVKDARVSLATFQSKKGKNEETNREGIAEFKKIQDGYYRVWARADGFKPALFEFLHVSGEAEKKLRLGLQAGFSGVDLYFESPGVLARSKQLAREGVAAMGAQMYAEAEELFLESLSLCPSDPATHQNLALIYTSLSRWEEAEKSLGDAEDLLYILGEIGEIEAATAQAQRAELDELRRSIPIRRLREEADKALEQENAQVAIEKLRELVELEPENGENYYYLANALSRDGKIDQAILAIDKALEKDPDEDRYRRFRLSIEQTGKRRSGEQAQAVIEEIEKLQDAHDYQAVLARSEKATEELAEEYQGQLMVQIARANIGLNRPEEAVAAYRKSLNVAPDTVEFRKEFTAYLIELERFNEAFSSLQQLTERTSTAFDQALFDLAKELTQKGKQAQARVAFERVLEVNPDFAEAYYELGVEYYYGAQDKERARTMLKRYVEIGKDPELLDNAQTLLKVIK